MLFDVVSDFEIEEEIEEERECEIPRNLDFVSAFQRFERIANAKADSGGSRLFYSGIANRLKRRFGGALEFINESAENCAQKTVFVSCADLDAVFNSADFGTELKSAIKEAANLVSVLERKCAEFSFPQFYLSIRGKTDKIIL